MCPGLLIGTGRDMCPGLLVGGEVNPAGRGYLQMHTIANGTAASWDASRVSAADDALRRLAEAAALLTPTPNTLVLVPLLVVLVATAIRPYASCSILPDGA